MLQDIDRIFRNLYGTKDWHLPGARARSYATVLSEGLLGVYEWNMRDMSLAGGRQSAAGGNDVGAAAGPIEEMMLRGLGVA